MQLFLQPMTEHYCDPIFCKLGWARSFASSRCSNAVGKCCGIRCISISFAA
jgi:hypothetical protein